ncbi:MAG: bifunctional DNA-binding transcriptional regulator/O6-methylguanine-DNA methyltransferase Ada [Myxococcales bacterium]|nr:bifunctional DNA-binding transcriptional regulator/O6-methylguanine-DNA methyltransferase Ada [Myxococcales bacterium]
MSAIDTSRQAQAQRVQADPRFALLVRRDPSADGQFVYSVATTGVYCRPSCRARQARPENLAFHDTASDAERLGFRPCKRCRPDLNDRREEDAAQVAALCRLIDASDDPPALQTLADHLGRSRFHTLRLFKKVTGITPKAYATAQRDQRLRDGLHSQPSVTAALYDAGFGSTSRLYEQSAALLGMRPRQYRRGGEAQTLEFSVCRCSLGQVLVAATAKGLCAIWLGDDAKQLVAALRARFPRADLREADATFHSTLAEVVRRIDDPQTRASAALPLDVQGTAFQQRVWQALSQIPPGQTRSYQQLADELGLPQGSRAVAQACAKNSLAVLIPCHRVVRASGALAGYRWGVERKRALLEREAQPTSALRSSTTPADPRRRS